MGTTKYGRQILMSCLPSPPLTQIMKRVEAILYAATAEDGRQILMDTQQEFAGRVFLEEDEAAAQAEADAAAAAALAAPQSAAEMVQQATDEVQAMQV